MVFVVHETNKTTPELGGPSRTLLVCFVFIAFNIDIVLMFIVLVLF